MKKEYRWIIFWFIGIAPLGLYAQQKPISVGERCPDFTMEKLIDYGKTSARLSDFKTPLILFQFCTPRCKSCVATLPVLDSVKRAFAGRVTVILVTTRSAADLELGKRNMTFRRRYTFPYVVEDSTLHRLFPHAVNPHMVWISSGVVKGITGFDEVTPANVQAVMEGKPLGWKQKAEVLGFDYSKPLLVGNDEEVVQPSPLYYTTVTAGMAGVQRKKIVDSSGGTKKLLLVNFSLLELYLNSLVFHRGTAQPKRMVWEVEDSARYLLNPAKVQAGGEEERHFFTYESRLPVSVSLEEQYEQMRLDLNRYFGMRGRVEKRKQKCWVLLRVGKGEDWPQSPTGKYPPDIRTVEYLVGHWDLRQDLPPVLDETGLPRGTRVQIMGSIDDMEAVRKSLKRYGLYLEEAEREIEVFVFAKKEGG